jgi:putative transposase
MEMEPRTVAVRRRAPAITRLSRRWGEVTITLVGRVRFRWTRPLPGVSRGCSGRITGGRLIKDPLGWHISFRIEEPAIEVPANHHPPVGVDRGVVHTMALSDGSAALCRLEAGWTYGIAPLPR